MSDPKNNIPIDDESFDEEGSEEQATSQSTMLFTMLLLTAALLLTGRMMMHYARANLSEAEMQAMGIGSTNSFDGFGLSTLAERIKEEKTSFATKHNDNSASAANVAAKTNLHGTSDENSIKQFFNMGGENVRWPRLKLTGFGSSKDGHGGFAIINGEQFHPGQLIDGKVKLVEVRAQDVVVEYMGETKTLIVDTGN